MFKCKTFSLRINGNEKPVELGCVDCTAAVIANKADVEEG